MLARKVLAALLALSTLAVLGGCPGGGRGSGTTHDSGTPLDSGPGHDGGMIDLGGGPHDMGVTFDAGPGIDGGGMCGMVVMPVTTTNCDMATYTCLSGCAMGDDTCVTNCYAADTHPMMGCELCVINNNIACANSNGCMSQWTAYDCCVNAMCATSTDPNCDMTMCPSQTTAFTNCFNGVFGASSPPACARDLLHCFGM